ncbi:hypothetical protein BCR36DRAFT_400121 [Piromyces finnis]|uniref:Uncharacterized protein n=1 Tax=Piromyces finnis TaxID=1754191 RepID=A0A1Y1UXL7_9FUNG|nr:hypothetical protein BCR36DRAFT_400121 [Piromyces finnis]|eukprot:ORX43041.1 hypothetical protein BCR36DRAFT_400121 [Piromyces finnis]
MEESQNIQYFSVEDIDYICNEISKNFKENKRLIPYIDQINNKVRNYLKKKIKAEEIDSAQSVGEPVTQSALSYFHKLNTNDNNELKELYKLTHNKMDYKYYDEERIKEFLESKINNIVNYYDN